MQLKTSVVSHLGLSKSRLSSILTYFWEVRKLKAKFWSYFMLLLFINFAHAFGCSTLQTNASTQYALRQVNSLATRISNYHPRLRIARAIGLLAAAALASSLRHRHDWTAPSKPWDKMGAKWEVFMSDTSNDLILIYNINKPNPWRSLGKLLSDYHRGMVDLRQCWSYGFLLRYLSSMTLIIWIFKVDDYAFNIIVGSSRKKIFYLVSAREK